MQRKTMKIFYMYLEMIIKMFKILKDVIELAEN